MKLSSLYSNKSGIFPPLRFNEGLNVILAEIRDPANLNKDTHNLGKTTLAHLIDFCLLKKRDRKFFLFKHEKLFRDFVFFLELRLGANRFVTIRRAVKEASKISLYYSTESHADTSDEPENEWAHWRVPFDKAKEILEGQLGFSVATQWPYRKPLGYALRLQDDFQDVFQLGKFRGKHKDWKPFLAEFLGLDGRLVQEAYDLAAEAENVDRSIAELAPQLVGLADSPDRFEGVILLRANEVQDLERRLSNFDFKLPDEELSQELVNRIEAKVAGYNERRYHLKMSLQSIDETLGETIRFDLDGVEQVFADAQVYFGEQIKRDYNDLLSFLKSISEERAEHLQQERTDIFQELEQIESQLAALNNERVNALATLREAKSLAKYREYSKRLIELKATLAILERQRDQMNHLAELRQQLVDITQKRTEVVHDVRENIGKSTLPGNRYRDIRLDFGSVVRAVLDRPAVLSCTLNREGNIEFQAEILDETGTATSADDGHTYRKLLCVAFDLAVFVTYLNESFIHFVFHDGVFESLDDRKKRCLLKEMRRLCSEGLQQIITVIDSDLPVDEHGHRVKFAESEIVRLLHDQGDGGRLFRIPAW